MNFLIILQNGWLKQTIILAETLVITAMILEKLKGEENMTCCVIIIMNALIYNSLFFTRSQIFDCRARATVLKDMVAWILKTGKVS